MLIIIHNGIFHADEVAGNAAIIKWNAFRDIVMVSESEFQNSSQKQKRTYTHSTDVLYIVRTRNQDIISWGLTNEWIVVMDCGGIYNRSMLNFDHHQDTSMPASNVLIWHYLLQQGKVDGEVHKAMMPFMEGISDFDTNKDNTNILWSEYNADRKLRNLSNIISGFNRDPRDERLQNKQFKKAVQFAITILDNEEYSAIERINAEAIYSSREILENNVAVFSEFCPIWKTKEEHTYAVLPNPQGWSLNSANSDTHPLPNIAHKDLIFAHKGRFIAVFKTKEAALEVASKL